LPEEERQQQEYVLCAGQHRHTSELSQLISIHVGPAYYMLMQLEYLSDKFAGVHVEDRRKVHEAF
jgi:hypothetical protein